MNAGSHAPSGSRKTRTGRRLRRRNSLIALVAAALLGVTAIVIVSAVSDGSRSGTLVGTSGIESFDPTAGIVNDEVHIVGTGFTGATEVRFNGVLVNSFNVLSDTEITTLVPEGATTGPITVDTPDGLLTSTSSFRPGAPVIAGFSPTSAVMGSVITITGFNMDGVKTVRINGREVPATNATATSVQATVPMNASSGLVTVVTDSTNATSDSPLTVTSASVDAVSPHFGVPGTAVTLSGANLGTATAVQFNGVSAAIASVSADGTSAVVTAPQGFSEGPITLVTGSGNVVTEDSFGTGPVITSITPAAVSPGATISVKGKYLTSTVSVSFAGTADAPAGFTVVSDSELSVIVPADAVTGPITVTAGGVATSTSSLTVLGVIDSFAPEIGPIGTTVTIYGSFNKAKAVSFNGIQVSLPLSVTGSKFTVRVPTGATSGPISVITADGTVSSTDSFTVGNIATIAPSYDRSFAPIRTITGIKGAPAGGTDFSKQQTVKLLGLVITGITPSATTPGTSTTAAATTTTAAKTTTTPAPATTAAPTTSAGTTVVGNSSTVPTTVTTTVPQTPFTGTATVSVGGSSSFSAKVTYTDPLNWSVTPSSSSLSVTIPVAGKSMTVSALTGSVSVVAGGVNWALTGTAAATTLITNKFTMNAGATVTFGDACPAGGSTTMCKDGAGPYARIDGQSGTTGLAAVVGNVVPNQTGMAYQAIVDLNAKSFNLDATYPAGTMATIRDGRLRMAYKDTEFAKTDTDVKIPAGSANNGLDIVVTGKSHVDVPYLGGFNPPSVTVWYLDGGSMLTFRFTNKRVIGIASLGTATFVTGHGSPVQATIMDEPRDLADGAWVFVGSMNMPRYVAKAFKTESGEIAAVATMTGNGIFEMKAMFRTPMELPKIPYVKTSFEGFEVGFRRNESNPEQTAEIFAGASGTISIDGNAPFGVGLEVAFSFAKEFSWSIALTGSGTDGRSVWPDIFGVKDFDLDKFSIEATFVGFELAGVGLAGSGTLPTKLLEYMGASDGLPQPATFVVNLSALDPCLEVTAGTPDNTTPLFSFPPETEVVAVNYFRISASPNGCMVGVYDVPAGVIIAQKGTFLGIKRDYMLAFNPNPTGPSKTPSFYGWDSSSASADQGAIKFRYKLSWGAGGWNLFPYFFIDGSLKLGNNAEVEVHGGCISASNVPNCYAEGFGDIDLGKGLRANMKLRADGIGSAAAIFVATGSLDLFGLKFNLSGSFTSMGSAPLGWDFSASADLPGKSNLIDQIGVRIGYGIRKNAACIISIPTMPCKKWLTDPLFSLTVSGDTGGLFKFINGAADAFGEAPVSKGGRYSLRQKWEPSWDALTFSGSSSISLGSLGTVSAGMSFYFCLTTECFGDVDANFSFDYKKGGKTWSFDEIPLNENWGFNFTKSYSDSFYESGKTGDNWGGFKGTVSGSIDVSLKVSYPPVSASLGLDFDLSAKAYLGAGGEWNYLGTYGVSYDSGGDRFCFSGKGYKICV